MPARRLFLALALATVLLVAGLAAPRVAAVVLVLDALLAVAWLIDLRRAASTPLSAQRRWPPMLVQGAPAEVEVEVANEAARPLTVLLREGLHPALAAGPLSRRLELAAGSRSVWSYPLDPRRRGAVTALPLTARVLGPWGLAWSQRQLIPPAPRRVYPQVRWEGQVGHLLTLARRRQLGTMPYRLYGMGSEPYALREYLPGDPLSKVHWKATARHGRLVTREETWERGARLVVLLDAARAMTSVEGDRSKLDHALAAALALARVAAARGDKVTVLAFSDRVEREVRIKPGSSAITRAYAALYDLEARLVEPAYDLVAERVYEAESRSATVVLFTSVVDLAAAELLKEALLRLERRHRPLLLNLEDPEIVRLAAAAPETPAAAFAQVSALDILLANRRLGRRLRRAGVRVVNTPADRLALEALEAYLALFRVRMSRPRVA